MTQKRCLGTSAKKTKDTAMLFHSSALTVSAFLCTSNGL